MRDDSATLPGTAPEADRGATPTEGSPLVYASQQMHEILQLVARVATGDAKVLITGESGVGKDLIAREIHARSPRASKPY
ncbi:MAG TPA: sigma 54-interacting transcriptional regulator, partial [Vicinamibacterales bacterium]